ncbi:hypothetical protein KAW50_03425 [candidate division WOR-3 bacterium]|nr:hypothetical protein [candidate division WOR-3 bacterium]
MIKTIQELVKTKRALDTKSRAFDSVLKRTYPCLVKDSIRSLAVDVDQELDLLLSSSLIHKSTRICFPAKTGWKKEVVLTRNPGLKRPYESDVAWTWFLSHSIKDSLKFKREAHEIDLSSLKENPKINQERLEYFRNSLKRLSEISKKLEGFLRFYKHGYYGPDTGEDTSQHAVNKDLSITVEDDTGFAIDRKRKGKGDKKDPDAWESDSFKDFETERGYGSPPELEIQEECAKNWGIIHKKLLKLEERKREFVKQLKELLADLKDFNKPYRVMQKLMQ